MNEQLIKKEEEAAEITAQPKPETTESPKPTTVDRSKTIEDIELIWKENQLRTIGVFNKQNIPYVITYDNSNENGKFRAYEEGIYFLNKEEVIGSLFLKDSIVDLYDEKYEETVHVLSGNIDKKIYLKMKVIKTPANFNHDTVVLAQEEVFNARVPYRPLVIIEYIDENNEIKQLELNITPLYTTDKGYMVKSIDILPGYGVRFNDDSKIISKDSIDPLPEKLHKIQVFSLDNIPEIKEKIPIVQENRNINIESIRTSEQIDADVWIEYYDPNTDTNETMILEENKDKFFLNGTFLTKLNIKQGYIVTVNNNITYFYDSVFRGPLPMMIIRYTQSLINNEKENQPVNEKEFIKPNEKEKEEEEAIIEKKEKEELEAEAETEQEEKEKEKEHVFWFIVKFVVILFLLILLIFIILRTRQLKNSAMNELVVQTPRLFTVPPM